jgi:cellulose synthase/poly-beta-1,6-N-acetylglucosamine synthase-like glycosyltransferase
VIDIVKALFWIYAVIVIYIYFGYPLLLCVLSRLRPRRGAAGEDARPTVTFIIPAFNEEQNIAAKLENTIKLDYPIDRLEILVASNGSTDHTNDIVRSWPDQRVRLIALEQPGKLQALNEGACQASGEVLVFTDADFMLDRHSLLALVRPFVDAEVGGVCGCRKPGIGGRGDATGAGEGLYARWDKWQKIRESEIGSVFAADGLLYALRRELYVPVIDPAQADDIAISARVVLQGRRLVFEPQATAWEHAVVEGREEFQRKIRVTNHSVRALLNLGSALVNCGLYSFELLSHKLIRHFVPFFLVAIFIGSISLSFQSPLYELALKAQCLFYGLATIGAVLRSKQLGRIALLYIPYYFCFVNAAAFFGILSIATGRKLAAWSTRSDTGEMMVSTVERMRHL